MLRSEAALALVDRISSDPVFESVIGTLRLTVGLAIIIGHDHWDGWVAALVSLVGWMALFSGMSTMFLPPGTLGKAVAWLRFKEKLSLYALVSALLGAALLMGALA